MIEGLPLGSAIGWVHIRLVGGWKLILLTTGAYVALIAGAIYLTVRTAMPGSVSSALEGWSVGLLLLQLGAMLLFGAYRVGAAIRHDLVTNAMESHRLMPLQPAQVLAGYLLGGTAQVWGLVVANLLLAVGVGLAASINPFYVLAAHGLMLIFGLMLWTAVAFWSFITRFAIGLLIIGGVVTFGTQGLIVLLLPGARVLAGPLIGRTVFDVASWDHLPTLARGVSVLLQLGVAVLFFLAAARKYRRPDRPGFGMDLGWLLLALWTLATALGLFYHQTFQFDSLWGREADAELIASLISLLLLGLLPVGAAARAAAENRRAPRPVALWRRLAPPLILCATVVTVLAPATAVVAAMAIDRGLALSGGLSMDDWAWSLRPADMTGAIPWTSGALTLATALAFWCFAYFALRVFHRINSTRGPVFMFVWMLITWLGPVIADVVREVMTRSSDDHPLRWISGLSPIGVLANAWVERDAVVWAVPGAAAQLLLAALMAGAFYLTQKRRAA